MLHSTLPTDRCKRCGVLQRERDSAFRAGDLPDWDETPRHVFHCGECSAHIEEWDFSHAIGCPRCAAEHNSSGELLARDWRDTPDGEGFLAEAGGHRV